MLQSFGVAGVFYVVKVEACLRKLQEALGAAILPSATGRFE